jgi:hypothetical protein
MNDFGAYLIVGFFLSGVVISVASGMSWQTTRLLHLVPAIYGFCGYWVIAATLEWMSYWAPAMVFGLLFYVVGWISLSQGRQYERRRRLRKTTLDDK